MELVILVCIGLFLLVGGIFMMRYGLKQMLAARFHRILSNLTGTPWRALLAGTLGAAFMQSSTALSLITIGLVSAEYITFPQGLAIILGANIGTCTTVQLLSLALPDEYFIPLLLLSLVIALIAGKLRHPALAFAGLMAMFSGLALLSELISGLSAIGDWMEYLALAREAPGYGILGGIIITTLFQSSSAATGVIMTMANDGLIDLRAAAYVVYGNNIGSCLSSLLVGAAAPLAAKRVAMSHIALNVLGCLFFLPITGFLIKAATLLSDDFAGQVAMIHTLFNILSSLAVMPIINHFARLITLLVPPRR